MRNIVVVALATATAFYAISCKKETQPNATLTPLPEAAVYDVYLPLKTGNYWVYQIFDVDSLGNGFALNQFDSCYISKDTTIRGNTYYFLASTSTSNDNYWLRDSLHYLVTDRGKILFSSEDFTSVFESRPVFLQSAQPADTVAWLTQKMVDKDVTFATPAGSYKTKNLQSLYDMYPMFQTWGARRLMHRRFAKNIGVVSETKPFYINHPRYSERRLLRYHLN